MTLIYIFQCCTINTRHFPLN